MEWLLIPCVALGFAIGWFTTRKRPMRARRDYIEALFRTVINESIDALNKDQLERRPLDLTHIVALPGGGSIQFYVACRYAKTVIEGGHEPLLILEKT